MTSWKLNSGVFDGQVRGAIIEVKHSGTNLSIRIDEGDWHDMGRVEVPHGYPSQESQSFGQAKVWDEDKKKVVRS